MRQLAMTQTTPTPVIWTYLPVTALPRATRIGVPNAATREFFGDTVQADCFNTALRELNDAGGNIIELDFTPFYESGRVAIRGAWLAERLSVIDDLFFDNPEALHPVTRQIIGRARKLTAVDAFRGMYRLAELKRKTELLLQQVDVRRVFTIPDVLLCCGSGVRTQSDLTPDWVSIPILSI